jgi:antitoxin MazE
LAREARLEESSTVDISVNNGTLMVVPIETSPTYRLDDLIAGITDENRHVEIGTGSAKGNEFC